jgi:hypothetical protein
MGFRRSTAICLLALLVFSSSAAATNEFEPNDNRDTAAGPLEGGVPYTATFETDNDVDWYVFYIKTYSQMDFSASQIKSEGGHVSYFYLRDKDGKYMDSFSSGGVNQTNHLLLTMNPGRYYLEVEGATKDVYRFQIDPAAAITPSRDCGEAIVSKEDVSPQLVKVTGELSKVSEKLVKPSEEVAAAEARLLAIDGRWEKFLVGWKVSMHRLAARRGISPYARRQRKRSLLATKRSMNLKLKSRKASAKQRLAAAQATQAKVLQQRASLQAVEAQNKTTLSQAEAQIAASC